MTKKSHHIVPNSKGGWSVKKGRSIRASKSFASQQEALEYGRQLCIRSGGDLVIHRSDGTILQRDTYSGKTVAQSQRM